MIRNRVPHQLLHSSPHEVKHAEEDDDCPDQEHLENVQRAVSEEYDLLHRVGNGVYENEQCEVDVAQAWVIERFGALRLYVLPLR